MVMIIDRNGFVLCVVVYMVERFFLWYLCCSIVMQLMCSIVDIMILSVKDVRFLVLRLFVNGMILIYIVVLVMVFYQRKGVLVWLMLWVMMFYDVCVIVVLKMRMKVRGDMLRFFCLMWVW